MDNLPYVGATDPDMVCVPDPATIRVVPWASEAVALAFCEVKELELATFSRVINSWEREHLMLLV